MATVYWKGTHEDLRRLLAKLPRVLAGTETDLWGVARGLQLRLGNALLSKVQQDFIRKSRGGTGEDGITWSPLKRETIAARRPPPQKRRGERPRGLLTAAQDERWRKLFAGHISRLMSKFGLGPDEAKKRAAQLAWATLKAEGARTRIGTLGNRQVDMGRDTDRMFRAFSPGVDDRPSDEAEQVFQTPPGRVIVGNNVPYFKFFHRMRPCWPLDGRLPAAWWQSLIDTYRRGLVRAVALIVSSGKVT